MENIMVLGAGALQLPLIEKVKLRGFNPVVMSLNPEEPGMKIVKDSIIDDFCDEQRTLEWAKKYNIKAIITDQTDLPVRTIAYVNEKLGLIGVDYKTACLFTDKFLMREKCKQLGIKTLRYKLVSTLQEAKEFFDSLNGKSVIIKPINNQGSKGVCKVKDKTELEEQFNYAKEYSRGEALLVEEFIIGSELVIEGIAYNDCAENLICGDTFYFTSMPDTFSACQRIFPSRQSKTIVDKALLLNKEIIKGFGLSRGLTHAEYIIDGEDIYLIEIAARGGGVYISSDIIPLMTDFDTTNYILDMALFDNIEPPQIKNNNRVVCYIAFYLPEGIVTNVKGVDEVLKMRFVHHNNLSSIYEGKRINKNTNKTSRFFMVLEAKSFDEMDSNIETIHSTLNIMVSNNHVVSGIIWN